MLLATRSVRNCSQIIQERVQKEYNGREILIFGKDPFLYIRVCYKESLSKLISSDNKTPSSESTATAGQPIPIWNYNRFIRHPTNSPHSGPCLGPFVRPIKKAQLAMFDTPLKLMLENQPAVIFL